MRILFLASCLFLGLGFVGCGGGDGQPDGVGNVCEEDADCMTGNCYLGPGGGYCTTECDNEGATDEECPVDTICKPIQGGPARCLLICGSETSCDGADNCADDFCPDGSGCVNVSDSEFDGCEPDPQ